MFDYNYVPTIRKQKTSASGEITGTLAVIGVHTTEKVFERVALSLGLENPKGYTSHCGRRSAIMTMVNADMTMAQIKLVTGMLQRHSYISMINTLVHKNILVQKINVITSRILVHLNFFKGHKSDTVLQGYIESSDTSLKRAASTLSVAGEPPTKRGPSHNDVPVITSLRNDLPMTTIVNNITFTNCPGVTYSHK
jgi:hypothetical protein